MKKYKFQNQSPKNSHSCVPLRFLCVNFFDLLASLLLHTGVTDIDGLSNAAGVPAPASILCCWHPFCCWRVPAVTGHLCNDSLLVLVSLMLLVQLLASLLLLPLLLLVSLPPVVSVSSAGAPVLLTYMLVSHLG